MDIQVLFNVVIGVAGAFGGWILNNISQSIRTLDKEVRQMPLTYVTQSTYQRDIDDIKNMLGRIFDKLDEKADK